MQVKAYLDDGEALKQVKGQNAEYQELILKYEEQSRIRESELSEMQRAIKQQVEQLEEQNRRLEDELQDSKKVNNDQQYQLEYLQ